jgi:hypothetical protein
MSEKHLSQEILDGAECEKGVGYIFTVFVKRYPTPFSPRALHG